MGRRGPAPKPTILKIRAGSQVRRNKHEPQPQRGRPRCPAWLTAEAKAAWRQVTPLLEDMGVLTKVDGNALVRYCQLWARWKKAELFIQQHGDMYALRDERGRIRCFQQYPQVAIAHRLSIALTKLEAEFGMTPSSRSRIYVPVVRKPSKLDEFLRSHALSRGAQSAQP